MIVQVHDDDRITLEDPDDFKTFSVRAGERRAEEILAAFRGDAQAVDDDHVFVSIERLHALGERHGGADWRAGCDGMIAFAKKQGWVDEARGLVRAHIER